MDWRVGIDVGGTFTDLVALGPDGQLCVRKVPSTPTDPSEAVATAIEEFLLTGGASPNDVTFLAHGTTVATNAVLQGRLAKTGMLTTAGFRDVVEIQRQKRPDVYDMYRPKPTPIIPRRLRLEVDERIDHDGTTARPLDLVSAEAAIRQLTAEQVEAIAICLLHSYANPSHERQLAEMVRRLFPHCAISLSSNVDPQFREFERFSTTSLNAALIPVLQAYIQTLESRCRDLRVGAAPVIMQSNGGMASPTKAAEFPVHLLLSGPSAGVIGAVHVAAQAGYRNVITLDMGGTSTEVCLIRAGSPAFTSVRTIAGFPIRSRMVDVVSLGAGGGSIAWIDRGGMLRVGPVSAGADPGPVCYARGGEHPTVTDAHVVLGHIDANGLLGGRMAMDRDGAADAIRRKIAEPLGLVTDDAAAAIIAVVNSNIAQAIQLTSVEQGEDPRDFALFAYGGAGPLHAAAIARKLGGMRVIVPEAPGLLCARGLLVADVRSDFVQTRLLMLSDEAAVVETRQLCDVLESRAAAWMSDQPHHDGERFEYAADIRYKGQNYELTVPTNASELRDDLTPLIDRFHDEHRRVYGHHSPGSAVEAVSVRLSCHSAISPSFPEAQVVQSGSTSRPALAINEARNYSAIERESLGEGDRVSGPLIISQMDSTTLVLAGQSAEVDHWGNLQLSEAQR